MGKMGHFWPFKGRPRPRWRPNPKVVEQKNLSFLCSSIPQSLKKIRQKVRNCAHTENLFSDGDAVEIFENAITSERVVGFRRSWYRWKGLDE